MKVSGFNFSQKKPKLPLIGERILTSGCGDMFSDIGFITIQRNNTSCFAAENKQAIFKSFEHVSDALDLLVGTIFIHMTARDYSSGRS